MMKKFLTMALAATMALSLVACGGGNTEGSTLTLGTSADYPPFEFHILEDGADKIVGIDVALAYQIAEDMDSQLEITDMDFDNLLTLMAKGDVDFVIAAMEIKDERLAVADCSDPYYTDAPPMILTKKENVDLYTSLEDFSGKTVGAQTGTTKADIILEDMPGAQDLLLAKVGDLVNNLIYDKCDALVLDGAVALKYVEANPDLAIVEAIDMGEAAEPYRVWVAKDDPKGLLPSINETIARVTTDGTMTTYIEEANELSSQAMD